MPRASGSASTPTVRVGHGEQREKAPVREAEGQAARQLGLARGRERDGPGDAQVFPQQKTRRERAEAVGVPPEAQRFFPALRGQQLQGLLIERGPGRARSV
jgi:hypothetical protein